MRSFRDLRVHLCVLVHFDYFPPLLCRRDGDNIYTLNLSSSLLPRDSRKCFSWASVKDTHTYFARIFFWGRFQGPGLRVPENSAWGNPGQGGTGLGTWLLVPGHSLRSLYNPPPLGQAARGDRNKVIFVYFCTTEDLFIHNISSPNVY